MKTKTRVLNGEITRGQARSPPPLPVPALNGISFLCTH